MVEFEELGSARCQAPCLLVEGEAPGPDDQWEEVRGLLRCDLALEVEVEREGVVQRVLIEAGEVDLDAVARRVEPHAVFAQVVVPGLAVAVWVGEEVAVGFGDDGAA